MRKIIWAQPNTLKPFFKFSKETNLMELTCHSSSISKNIKDYYEVILNIVSIKKNKTNPVAR